MLKNGKNTYINLFIYALFALFFAFNISSFAQGTGQAELDTMLNRRLNLSPEQQNYIRQNRPAHRQQMQHTYTKMQNVHSRIQDVYNKEGLPRYQADLKTAPMKAELAILKQEADRQKTQNRKDFENILSKEQRQEFQKIRQEYRARDERRKPPARF